MRQLAPYAVICLLAIAWAATNALFSGVTMLRVSIRASNTVSNAAITTTTMIPVMALS